MTDTTEGRRAILRAGMLAAAGVAALGTRGAQAAEASLIPNGASALKTLAERLAKAPRRRDFKTVPMIVDNPDQWDHEALQGVLAYRGGPKQAWDNTDIKGPWLNLMRNSLNGQVWAFRHPDFLVVSATHASAHLALYDQAMWDKYHLAKLAGPKFPRNTLIEEPKAASANPADFQSADGAFSPHDNAIPVLQRRGVVFLACHNAIWELSEKLLAAGTNPDKLSHEAMAAELTNHLIPGVVLSPGAVATMAELQMAGFHYSYAA